MRALALVMTVLVACGAPAASGASVPPAGVVAATSTRELVMEWRGVI